MKEFLKIVGSFVLVLAILLVVGRDISAQGTVTVKLDSIDISRFPRLTAYATVIDENGLPVTDLTKDRFELVEDGESSFPPDEVQAITNDKAAVTVLILIDLSETMRDKSLEAAKEATAKFLEKLLNEGNDPDQAAFIGFGQQVDIKAIELTEETREVPFTNDMGRLLNVVNFLEVESNAGTPLYDAVYRGVKIISQQPGRRAIIVMTDGGDVGSTLKDGDPIAEAQRQHIPIFPIGLSSTGRLTASGEAYLERLAELTGGQFQKAPTPDELGQKFEEVLDQLKVQYVLTYESRLAEMDGQYHSLLLRVNTARGQSFDETKFQLGPPAVTAPAATVPAVTPRPGETIAPQPAATPVPGGEGMFEGIINWVSQNILLAAGIAVAALLLLLMLIIFVVLLMRRRSTAPEQAWGVEGYGAIQADWPTDIASSETAAHAGDVDFGSLPTGAAPTAGPPAPPTAGTQVAPSSMPPARDPFSAPPPQPAQAPPPSPAPDAAAPGGTVIIKRGPKLKVLGMLVDRKHSSRRFDVDKRTVTIGRAPGNAIVLDHPTVSRQHATIKLEKDEFRLYDLGSANGTFVDDKRVREPIALQDGMLVRFGEMEFTFKLVTLE